MFNVRWLYAGLGFWGGVSLYTPKGLCPPLNSAGYEKQSHDGPRMSSWDSIKGWTMCPRMSTCSHRYRARQSPQAFLCLGLIGGNAACAWESNSAGLGKAWVSAFQRIAVRPSGGGEYTRGTRMIFSRRVCAVSQSVTTGCLVPWAEFSSSSFAATFTRAPTISGTDACHGLLTRCWASQPDAGPPVSLLCASSHTVLCKSHWASWVQNPLVVSHSLHFITWLLLYLSSFTFCDLSSFLTHSWASNCSSLLHSSGMHETSPSTSASVVA